MKEFEKDLITKAFRDLYNKTRGERNLNLLSKEFEELLQKLYELGGNRHFVDTNKEEVVPDE